MWNKAFKGSAKALLAGFWLPAITVVSLSLALIYAMSVLGQTLLSTTGIPADSPVGGVVVLFSAMIGGFLSAPVVYGFKRMLWLRLSGQEVTVSDVFYMFGRPGFMIRYLGMTVLRDIIIVLPAAVLIIPVAIFAYVTEQNPQLVNGYGYVPLLSLGCVALVIVGMVLMVMQAMRYTLSDFCLIADEDGGIKIALRRSTYVGGKNMGLLVKLYFSLIPQYLLSLTGFGQLYSTPFITATVTCAAKWLLNEEEAEQQ